MKDQTYDKGTLIERIVTNRSNHRTTFDEGMAGYAKEVLNRAEEITSRVRAGDSNVYGALWELAQLPRPEDHTKDYDGVIDMLQFSTDTEVVLTHGDFLRYVRDDWPWKAAFAETTSNYGASMR